MRSRMERRRAWSATVAVNVLLGVCKVRRSTRRALGILMDAISPAPVDALTISSLLGVLLSQTPTSLTPPARSAGPPIVELGRFMWLNPRAGHCGCFAFASPQVIYRGRRGRSSIATQRDGLNPRWTNDPSGFS